TGACIATDRKPSGSAMRWPRRTSWPSPTIGLAGLPMCWTVGTAKDGAKGNCRIGDPRVSDLESGGWMPWAKLLRRSSLIAGPSVELLRALDQLLEVLLGGVARQTGMDDACGAALRGLHEVAVRPAVRVLDEGIALLVPGEDRRVDLDAVAARRAAGAVDPGRHAAAGGLLALGRRRGRRQPGDPGRGVAVALREPQE